MTERRLKGFRPALNIWRLPDIGDFHKSRFHQLDRDADWIVVAIHGPHGPEFRRPVDYYIFQPPDDFLFIDQRAFAADSPSPLEGWSIRTDGFFPNSNGMFLYDSRIEPVLDVWDDLVECEAPAIGRLRACLLGSD